MCVFDECMYLSNAVCFLISPFWYISAVHEADFTHKLLILLAFIPPRLYPSAAFLTPNTDAESQKESFIVLMLYCPKSINTLL